MCYTSNNENIPWGTFPNTGPITRITTQKLDSEESKVLGQQSVHLHSLTPGSAAYRMKEIASLLEEMSSDSWITNLSHPSARERLVAIRALEAAGSAVCMEAQLSLQKALRDDSEEVRAAAVEVLGNLGEQAPVDSLMNMLSDPSWNVRAAAVQVLSNSRRSADFAQSQNVHLELAAFVLDLQPVAGMHLAGGLGFLPVGVNAA